MSKLKNKETSPTRNSLLTEGFFFGRHINKTAEFMVPPCQALSCHSFQFFTPYETDTSLRRCLSPSRVISITRLNHSFKHFSFVILLFHFLMISLLLLDVGLSCFVCLVQVIADRARAVEGKFFLSFHLSPPPPPPSPLLHSLLSQTPQICLPQKLFTPEDSISPPPPHFPQNQKYRLPLLRLVSLGVLRMIYEVCIKDSYTLR